MSYSRRAFLATGLAAIANGTSLTWPALAAPALRLSEAGPGTAATILQVLIKEDLKKSKEDQNFVWVGGNPGQPQTQLLAGTLDVGGFGPLGLAQARSMGHDVVIFGPVLKNHGRWIVRGDSPFRKPHDLIGKRIATQPETSETFKQAALAAAAAGIDLKTQTKLFFGPPIVNRALFERGDVDAVIELEPVATRLVAKGARQIATVQEMWEMSGGRSELFLVGLAAPRSWLASNTAIAARLARLYLAANQRVIHQPDLFKKYHNSLSVPDTELHAIDLLAERMPSVYATEWNETILAGIDSQLAAAAKLGLIPAARASDLCNLDILGKA